MSRQDILTHLRNLANECGGVIPFQRFMHDALYHPELGYYSANISDVGVRGDFSTSATLGKELARAIASWIIVRAGEYSLGRLSLIEVGAGNGDLARNILRLLGWWRRLRCDYVIVETSPVLLERQRKKLVGFGVRWAPSMEEALLRHKGQALIFSNEVPDAFPCRVFEKTREGWSEMGILISPEGNITEVLMPPEANRRFREHEALPNGQRIECHDSYGVWLESWSGDWKRGSLLTIDYGGRGDTVYQRRPLGTLRAYWKHQLLTGRDVYARYGRQDITSDVNFDDLIRKGNALGWKTRTLESMSDFLRRWDPQAGYQSSRFTESGGVGDSFMVLEQET